MSQYLPYSGFKRLNQKEIDKFCLTSIGENSSVGYIFEVSLEYSDQLHELHNDYLLAPEKLVLSHNMLPHYCSSIANEYYIKIGGVKDDKDKYNKDKYVLHYRNLQLCLSLGTKLTKVYRMFNFKQTNLFNYKNTLILIQTKYKMLLIVLKKTFIKLINNSVYGKAMENVRKRIKVKVAKNAKDYKKYVSRPSFLSQKRFSRIFAIHEIKSVLPLDKSIYVGFSILN